MASSRLLFHFTSSLLLTHSKRATLLLFPSLHLNTTFSFRPLSTSIRFYCAAVSTAVKTEDVVTPDTSSSCGPHPWPEWDQFVDKMKTKGYFDEELSSSSSVYKKMDQNRVKNACLKFARERFDILSSLPKDDIRAVVEGGCPNLFRKPINSAKRLRAFLRVDEGDACGACIQRESCDKAYVIASEDEGARTVDVVRILMSYAVDPVLQSEGKNTSVKEQVQESARKLLAELIRLSDTTLDAALAAHAVSTTIGKEPRLKVVSKNKPSQKIEMKREEYGKVSNRNRLPEDIEMKRGDWLCSKCNFLNFARNVRCLECKEDGPGRVNFNGTEMKAGDWTCSKCEFMNFSRNKKCFRCDNLRPKRELNPGEWECPSCDYVNFRNNNVCKKCNCDRPNDNKGSQYEDHMWRKPRGTRENKSLKFGDDEDEDDEYLDEVKLRPKKELQPGDWECPSCDYVNFSRNKVCKKCNCDRPNDNKGSRYEDNMRRKPRVTKENKSLKFGGDEDEDDEYLDEVKLRPKKVLQPGDWECPSCDFLNFSRNKVCKKCDCDRPSDNKGSRYEDNMRRKPRGGKGNKSLKFGDDEDDDDDDDDYLDDDDILPRQEREPKFVVSKRAAPSERRFTSARKRNYCPS